MSLDSLLFLFAASLTIASIVILYRRSRDVALEGFNTESGSIYTDMSALTKMFRVLSINVNPWLCVLLIAMLSLTVAFSIVDLLAISSWNIAPIAIGLSLFILFLMREIAQMRRRQFEKKLQDAIGIMQAASMAGATPHSALRTVAENAQGLIKSEFTILLVSLQYGSTIDSATARICTLYDSESTRMLMQVLIVRWKMGGDLTELLNSVAKMVRERLSIRLRTNAKLSGAKYSAIFMGLCPYLLIPFFLSSEPQWLQIFIDHPMGLTTLGSAVFLQLIGIIWLRQVLRVSLLFGHGG